MWLFMSLYRGWQFQKFFLQVVMLRRRIKEISRALTNTLKNGKDLMTSRKTGFLRFLFCLPLFLFLSGCDPSINFYGSFFPAWIWCLTIGIALTVLLRFVFAALRLERNMGPLIVIYLCLALLLTCVSWLVLFRN
jgi:hypothetical protein